MKRLLSLVLCFALVLSIPFLSASAADIVDSGICGDSLTWTLDSDGVLTISGRGAMYSYNADSPWADASVAVKTAVIESGVTSIGANAFRGCAALTNVTVPESVEHVGAGSFANCTGLTSVTIPEGVPTVEGETFFGCSGLKSITIPTSVTSIGIHAFYDCTALENITIPESVTSIGEGAFSRCAALTSIVIPAHVTSIDWTVFSYCSGLTSVTIPEGVTSIGGHAFERCTGLTSVTIPASVSNIGPSAFCGCTALTGVYFGGNAPTVGSYVFQTYDERKDAFVNIPDLILYYIEGKTGWTTPTWSKEEYPTAPWKDADVPAGEFRDVSPAAWYAGAVDYAVSNKLMNGMGGGKFEPNGSMTRAMLVTVLWRYAGSPAEGTNGFSDVPNGDWYTQAVAWASKNGVVNGVGSGRFDPNGKITREQMAVILFRYANQQGINTGKRGDFGKFADANKVSSYAVDALQWAVAEGIVGGSSEGGKLLLHPQGNATRAEVATILMRFLENVMK